MAERLGGLDSAGSGLSKAMELESVVPEEWFKPFQTSVISAFKGVQVIDLQVPTASTVVQSSARAAQHEALLQLAQQPPSRKYRGERRPGKRAYQALEALSDALVVLLSGQQLRTWRGQAELELVRKDLSTLDGRVVDLSRDLVDERAARKTLESRLESVERSLGLASAEDLVSPAASVDWGHLRTVVEAASHKLGWSLTWAFLESERIARASVPSQQDDQVASQKLEFYSVLASALDTEVLRAVTFEFLPVEVQTRGV